MSESEVICINLDETIEHYTKQLGYRLDMIFPADAPREALVSKDGESLRLVASPKSNVQSPRSQHIADIGPETLDLGPTSRSEWIVGRAGMEYRALSPRFSGQPPIGGTPSAVATHHIRLTKGGDVPDYVHYHKVDFQLIYCVKGRIKVVYEDQGEPFWLETGDCVLQPPEICHRVLECTAGAEVIEISMPAEHETWVEHDITLPTSTLNRMREFSGQRFVRHIAAANIDQNGRDLGISAATGGRCKAFVQKITAEEDLPANERESGLFFRLNDSEILAVKLSM